MKVLLTIVVLATLIEVNQSAPLPLPQKDQNFGSNAQPQTTGFKNFPMPGDKQPNSFVSPQQTEPEKPPMSGAGSKDNSSHTNGNNKQHERSESQSGKPEPGTPTGHTAGSTTI